MTERKIGVARAALLLVAVWTPTAHAQSADPAQQQRDASSAAPQEGPCCYVRLEVSAEGYWQGMPDRPSRPIEGHVFLNGTYAGKTPLVEGLPPGTYEVAVQYESAEVYLELVQLESDTPRRIVARAAIPPATDAERAAASAASDLATRQRLDAEHAHWEASTARVRQQHRRHTIAIAIVGAASGASLVIGTALILTAANKNEELKDRESEPWQYTTPEEWEPAERELEDLAMTRDRLHTAGIVLASVGLAGAIAMTTLLVVRPRIPPKPRASSSTIALVPYGARDRGGLILQGAF